MIQSLHGAWRSGWMLAVLVLGLSGCGGGTNDPAAFNTAVTSAQTMAQRMAFGIGDAPSRRALAAPGVVSPDTPPIGADELFAWAQWKFPELFPGAPATQSVTFQGTLYEVRAYANGNYLGVTTDGHIYGLGPFTSQALVGFGTLSDYAAQVATDYCGRLGPCTGANFSVPPKNANAIAGRSATFVVQVDALPKAHIRWQISRDQGQTFHDIPGATASQLVTGPLSLSDSGLQYRVLAGNAAGWFESGPVLLTVTAGDHRDYFPTQQGSWWKYNIYPAVWAQTKDTTRVVGTQLINGQSAAVFDSTDGLTGEVFRDLYVWSSDGVRSYVPESADPASRALNGVKLFQLPFQPGTSVPQVDVTVGTVKDLDGDGREEMLHITGTMSLVGIEDASVDAAWFGSTMHVRQVFQLTYSFSSDAPPLEVPMVIDEWYGDGVGLVKRQTLIRINGQEDLRIVSLDSFQAGPRSSDAIAPVVRAVEPGANTVTGARNGISVMFSTGIDPASILADTLIVSDASGQRVPGSARLSGATLYFDTDALRTGRYTATLNSDPRDLAGHALVAGKSWSFEVDRTGPRLVSTVPTNAARGVDLLPTISMRFSEALSANEPYTPAVNLLMLTDSGNATGSFPVTWVVQGSELKVTPTLPLVSNGFYRLEVHVRDTLLNYDEAPFTLSFQTKGGRFLPPVLAPGIPQSMVNSAAGLRFAKLIDLDGDGRLDLLFIPMTAGQEVNLYVAYGGVDGRFSNPTSISTGLGPLCVILSLDAGDLLGDGRAGIALGSNYCGGRWIRQPGRRSFASAEVLEAVDLRELRILPLKQGGGLGLVGFNDGQSGAPAGLSQWQRLPDGAWRAGTPVATGPINATVLASGDLDGDGWPDLVALSQQTYGRRLVVVRRQADGGFAAPESRDFPDTVVQETRPVVIDLNGDGRAEVVLPLARYNSSLNSYAPKVAILGLGPDGTLREQQAIELSNMTMDAAVVDINGDGLIDIVLAHNAISTNSEQSGQVGVLLQTRSGGFESESQQSVPLTGKLMVGDVTGDGRADVLVGFQLLQQKPNDQTSAIPLGQAKPRGGAAVKSDSSWLRPLRRSGAVAAGERARKSN